MDRRHGSICHCLRKRGGLGTGIIDPNLAARTEQWCPSMSVGGASGDYPYLGYRPSRKSMKRMVPIRVMAGDHKAGGQAESHVARMGELPG